MAEEQNKYLDDVKFSKEKVNGTYHQLKDATVYQGNGGYNEPNHQQSVFLKRFYGCNSCPYRGTSKCVDIQRSGYENGDNLPVEKIEKGKKHNNGICKGRFQEMVSTFDMMKKPTGFRLMRNHNLIRLQDYTNHLYSRLMDIKNEDGPLSDDEKDMILAFHKLSEEMNKRVEGALRQDEGLAINTQKLTPSQLNELIDDSAQLRKEYEEKRLYLEKKDITHVNSFSEKEQNNIKDGERNDGDGES